MLKFLVQTVNKRVVNDITFVLLDSIDFLNWKQQNTATYDFAELSDLDMLDKKYLDYVPVGTIEFVHNFLFNQYGFSSIPKPLNIPNILLDKRLTCRDVFNVNKNDLELTFNLLKNKVFLKSNDIVKSLENGCYDNFNPFLFKYNEYMVSELIDISSEYRCFVYKNELVGLKNYSGDFTMFPNVNKILEIINIYSPEAPVAYTLDVGCNENDTFIIELHNFYSCGLYGFSDFNRYPYMLFRWFKEYLKRINKI